MDAKEIPETSASSTDGSLSKPNTVSTDTRNWSYVSALTRVSAIFTVIFSGIALFSDGYNAAVVGYLNLLFAEIYAPDVFNSTVKTRLSNAFLIGEIVGMLGFGAIIDQIGRKTGVVLTTAFLILGTALSAAASGTSPSGLLWMLVVMRGLAGVGAGGEYPTCGTNSTEAGDENATVRKRRGLLVAMVGDFAIDFGFVIAGVVVLIVLACFQQSNYNAVWRTCFALGVVPPLCVVWIRYKIVNSTAFRKNAMKRHIPYWLAFKKYGLRVLATGGCWFLYDFVSYPFGIFSSSIISQFNPDNTIVKNIGYGTLINAFYLPGCVLGGLAMDRIGRRQTMALGFGLQAIIGFILGGALGPIQSVFPLFVVMYGIFVSLGEFGPGVATILISSESFATPLRGHMVGLSAAIGKAGAAIGIQVFTPIQTAIQGNAPGDLKGQQGVFLIASAFSLVGGLVTWFCIPDMSRELATEDEEWRQYCEAHGVDVTGLGEPLLDSATSGQVKQVGGRDIAESRRYSTLNR